MSRRSDRDKHRSQATGESHTMAHNAIAALAPHGLVIPTASDGQARFESLVFKRLNRLHRTEHRNDPPFTVKRCTPEVNSITVDIAQPHLSAVLNTLLPCAMSGEELQGVPGLRVYHQGRFLVLHHLRLAGRILIPASADQWEWAQTWLRSGLPSGTVVVWWEHPTGMLPIEDSDLSWRTEAHPGPVETEACQLASALLRRLGLVHGAPIPGYWPFYDLWSNPIPSVDGGIVFHLEWGTNPDSHELAQRLTDPRSPIALPEPLRARTQFREGSPRVRLHTSRGNQVLLRHSPLVDMPLHDSERISDLGPHRAPFGGPSKETDLLALKRIVAALTGEHALFPVSELRIRRRSKGGWTLTPPTSSGLLEHLRILACSRSYSNLWPSDLQDMLSLYDGRDVVRVRGVDFVFDQP